MTSNLSLSPDQYQVLFNNYLEIVEKTNQQLGLWSNPYGIIIGALAVLFTVLTIVAAIIIWRQGKDFKDAFEKALINYQKNLQDNLQTIGDEANSSINAVIEKYEKELGKLSGETRKSTQKIIDELKTEKNSITSRIQLSSIDLNQDPVITNTFGSSNNSIWGYNSIPSSILHSNSIGSKSSLFLMTNCPNCNTPLSVGINQNYCSSCGHKL